MSSCSNFLNKYTELHSSSVTCSSSSDSGAKVWGTEAPQRAKACECCYRVGSAASPALFPLQEQHFINSKNIIKWSCKEIVLPFFVDPALIDIWEGVKVLKEHHQSELSSFLIPNCNTINSWVFTFDNIIKNKKKVPGVYVTAVQATPCLLDSGSSIQWTRTKWQSSACPTDKHVTDLNSCH